MHLVVHCFDNDLFSQMNSYTVHRIHANVPLYEPVSYPANSCDHYHYMQIPEHLYQHALKTRPHTLLRYGGGGASTQASVLAKEETDSQQTKSILGATFSNQSTADTSQALTQAKPRKSITYKIASNLSKLGKALDIRETAVSVRRPSSSLPDVDGNEATTQWVEGGDICSTRDDGDDRNESDDCGSVAESISSVQPSNNPIKPKRKSVSHKIVKTMVKMGLAVNLHPALASDSISSLDPTHASNPTRTIIRPRASMDLSATPDSFASTTSARVSIDHTRNDDGSSAVDDETQSVADSVTSSQGPYATSAKRKSVSHKIVKTMSKMGLILGPGPAATPTTSFESSTAGIGKDLFSGSHSADGTSTVATTLSVITQISGRTEESPGCD